MNMNVALRVERFKAWLDAAMRQMNRDASHGMHHFERVRRGALELAAETSKQAQPNPEESLVLQLAALCHDVLDHKYLKDGEGRGGLTEAALKQEMCAALRDLSELTQAQVDDVCLISDNVSLSKELAGLLDEERLAERRLLELRNYVSDADKLDALGVGGIKRLAQYQAHRLLEDDKPLDGLSSEFLKDMVQKHLLHRVRYLRTPAARLRGSALETETLCLIASQDALSRIIEKVVYEQSLQGKTMQLDRRVMPSMDSTVSHTSSQDCDFSGV